MDQKFPLKAWGLLLLLSLIWGSSFILIKKGLIGLTPVEVGSIRIFSAFLFLLPFAFRAIKRIKREHLKYLISVGLVGSFFPAFLFAIAQTRLESSITGALNALTPLFTILIGILIYHQKQPSKVFIGVFLGFIGSLVLISASSKGGFGDFNFYALLVVLATIFYALNVNVIKYHLQELRSLTITSMSLLFVGPIAGFQLFLFTDFPAKVLSVEGTLLATSYIVILGVIGTAVALLIFNKLVNITNPLFTSSVTYIIPVVSVAWGLMDGEVLLITHLIGILAILIGVYVANKSSVRRLNKKGLNVSGLKE